MCSRLLFLLCMLSIPLQGFSRLSEAESYAQAHKEFPPTENEDLLHPRFTELYAKTAPTFFSQFLMRWGILQPAWSPYALENRVCQSWSLLCTMKQSQQVDIQLSEGSECIIVGPLFGQFHSLVRILAELKRRSYLDDELCMLKKNTVLIFNGDVVTGSPYSFETLTLVLTLFMKNPQQVIYLRGHSEDKERALEEGLKYDLQERASFVPGLRQLLMLFLDLLPTQVTLHLKKEQQCLRISNLSVPQTAAEKDLFAQIVAENRIISYAFHPGLTQREPAFATTVWSVFSAPTDLYRNSFNFHYDAFVIVRLSRPLSHSTISLYNRYARSLDPFKKSGPYSLLTGQQLTGAASVPIPESTITLGSTMDLSRTYKQGGFFARGGISAAVNRINREGGINHNLLRIFIADDGYSETIARANINKFIEQGITLFLSPLGSQTLAASLDLIREKKIYVLFPLTGASLFRDPQLESLINFRASYNSEAQALIYYMHTKRLSKTFALFYQDDSFGETALKGSEKIFKALGITQWITAPCQTQSVKVEEAVAKIKAANPDTIGLFSSPPATVEFLKQLGAEFLAGKKLFALSPLGESSFKQFLKTMGLHVVFSQIVPNPEAHDLLIVKEYRDEIKKLGVPIDTYSLEGYINATITADILKKTTGPISVTSVRRVIESLKNYQFKGLTLTYNPTNRQLSNDVWLETSPKEWVKQDLHMLQSLEDKAHLLSSEKRSALKSSVSPS